MSNLSKFEFKTELHVYIITDNVGGLNISSLKLVIDDSPFHMYVTHDMQEVVHDREVGKFLGRKLL